MTLIKSISGIRGTIGGKVGDNLTPVDAVKFAASYGTWLKRNSNKQELTVVVGRDARISGEIVQNLIVSTLQSVGLNILDVGLSTTPTVEMAVIMEKADGGIILTASHNPKEWNALKLLNEKGEFLNGEEGLMILDIADRDDFDFVEVDDLGTLKTDDTYIQKHIDKIMELALVNKSIIEKSNFKVVVDAVNSTGGISIPQMLRALGVTNIIELYCTPNGDFPHNPEPLKENLTEISELVVKEKADFGVVVDPDVDRLAIISEDGSMFGEEYTLVAVADYILSKVKGNTVSNLSSSRALRDVTEKHGGKHQASAVGEVNVVKLMKDTDAVIGGEGNGGIIYPELHYGRDSLVGVALFLSLLAEKNISCTKLKEGYPAYFMSKNKIQLTPEIDVDKVLSEIENKYKSEEISTVDGVKIDFEDKWVHMRKSNTEPIIRIYTEAQTQEDADKIAENFLNELATIAGI